MAYVRKMFVSVIVALCIHCSQQPDDSWWTKRKEVEENSDVILEFPLNCLRPDDDPLEYFYIRESSDKSRPSARKYRVNATKILNNETGQVDIRLDLNDTSHFIIGSKYYTCGILNASNGQNFLVSANFTVHTDVQITDKCLQMTPPRPWSPPAARRHGDPVCCVYSCLTGVKVWKQSSASGRKEFIYPGRDGTIDPGFSVDTTVSGTLLLTIFNVSGVGQSVTYGLERDGQRLGFGYNVSVIERLPRSDHTSTTATILSTATHLENNTQQNSTYPSTYWTVGLILATVIIVAFIIVTVICIILILRKRRVGDPSVAGIKESVPFDPRTKQPLIQ